jgi:hypothetical protein
MSTERNSGQCADDRASGLRPPPVTSTADLVTAAAARLSTFRPGLSRRKAVDGVMRGWSTEPAPQNGEIAMCARVGRIGPISDTERAGFDQLRFNIVRTGWMQADIAGNRLACSKERLVVGLGTGNKSCAEVAISPGTIFDNHC